MGGKNKRGTTSHAGFSLIELMLVVGLIGIMMAIAVPSYQASRDRATRHQAITYLLTLQIKQEYYWLNEGQYRRLTGLPMHNIKGVSVSEEEKPSAGYAISVTLQYLPKEDECRTLTITPVATLPSQCWLG
ncbi:prepilin-type N-terminal cleavage/methylation domain-containing protein [Alteromonas sp. 345S023]|uniref:Prepilin-type N-terminal cleavage/methylation domain-containing protein n=1 Tax=Alteromonas profundi TaxID=2696062 RepID=A0A7X5RLR0_9ALTE|nr:prepilin-type N-terminal cleavage/methylation domain-containing protein [Alteromonas profundi]NDV92177.1 prepilin-type N-terminal cleavage/methylation domain-containing protein [Alteromonas profundi]